MDATTLTDPAMADVGDGVVNGPEGGRLNWDAVQWRRVEADVVACQREGTTSLPRGRDHLEVSVSIAGLAGRVNGGALVGAVPLPVGGALDDEGVRA